MNRHEVQTGISQAWKTVEELGLGLTISDPSPLDVNDQFRDICIKANASYVDIYELGLKLSYYNFSFNDYSYFQFSWSGDNNVRYAYYPNPYLSGDQEAVAKLAKWHELLGAGLITHEDFLEYLRGRPADARIPLIRYENAPAQYKRFSHPCSHMHIGRHDDNRWAVDRLLTPHAFVLLIIKQYYGSTWRALENDQEENGNELETKLINAKQNSRQIGTDYFEEIERRSFYLG
ncbi:DUF2290 domain-containing protein [Mesorhizobium sp.]|uniref:DUF2290 domain-containing protein n=1 Tax=Mesorhizobium sp. TaxID=1871066 RepID=UPI002579AACB|nr:DUF2290 domain-containing protein [Mesorhizobium sp.]